MIVSEEIQVRSETARDTSIDSVRIFCAIAFGVSALAYQYMMDEEGFNPKT